MLEEVLAALNLANPIALLVNIVVSTVVGGIIFLIVVKVLAKAFSEDAPVGRAFLVVLVINLINIFLLGFIGGFLSAIPFAGYILLALPLLVWIGIVKALFSDMEIVHVAVIGVAGYIVSIFVLPRVVSLVLGYLPAIV